MNALAYEMGSGDADELIGDRPLTLLCALGLSAISVCNIECSTDE